MDFSWKVVIDAGAISGALIFATILRSKIRFFQKYLIPNALTAGFLLLPLYNYLMPAVGYTTNKLGELVYHLLNISFIAMSLRSSPPKVKGSKGKGVIGMSSAILLGYATQTILGLCLTLLFMPGIHPAFGMFLPLGFALGPGQAFAIGKGWESMGFDGASSVGLTLAAIGYLWACFGGIILINTGIKKGWIDGKGLKALKDKTILTGIIPADGDRPVGARLSTDTEALDSFSFHTAIVVVTYFLSFLLLKGLTFLLGFAGNAGRELAVNLWGINFIFSAITAILVRKVLDLFRLGKTFDDDTLSRISGFSVDYMLAGSLAAISLVFIGKYWLPILVMSTICGLMCFYLIPWFCSRLFHDHRFERMMMIYGVSTGTLTTGLALLRVTDPEYRTSVASDYMLSAGLTFLLAIPFIMTINLPAKAFLTGNMLYYWLSLGVACGYFLYVLLTYTGIARKRAFSKPGQLWYRE